MGIFSKKTKIGLTQFLHLCLSNLIPVPVSEDFFVYDKENLIEKELRLKIMNAIPNFRIIVFVQWIMKMGFFKKVKPTASEIGELIPKILFYIYYKSGYLEKEALEKAESVGEEVLNYIDVISKSENFNNWDFLVCEKFAGTFYSPTADVEMIQKSIDDNFKKITIMKVLKKEFQVIENYLNAVLKKSEVTRDEN